MTAKKTVYWPSLGALSWALSTKGTEEGACEALGLSKYAWARWKRAKPAVKDLIHKTLLGLDPIAMAGRLEPDLVTEMLYATAGLRTIAAERLGVTVAAMDWFLSKHPACQAAREQAREKLKDYAESKLFEKMRKGDKTALIFFLKTQAKDRGYIERVERLNANVDALEAIREQAKRLLVEGELPAFDDDQDDGPVAYTGDDR